MKKKKLGKVFYISLVLALFFVIWGAVNPESLNESAASIFKLLITQFGWFYLLSSFIFLVASLYFAFSRFGKIRLGKEDDRPEYSLITWFGMLFSAGMGIGLVFYGVAEPVQHYFDPATGQPETAEAARLAMRYSYFHWGLHPWAIYSIVALSLAYFQFRKGQKGLISATFYPLLGDRVNGPIGKSIDVLTVFATIFGVATSLGLGTLQINGGLSYLFDIPNNYNVQIIIIIVVTILYMLSAQTGLDRGIKILSNLNVLIATVLMLFMLFVGPTAQILNIFTQTLGGYIQNIIIMSFRISAFEGSPWVGSWTLFYWAWWIAWAPFVGSFIARVSKGRTIKEFIIGVLFVPSIYGFLWFATFGGSAIQKLREGTTIIGDVVAQDVTKALFVTLEQFPYGQTLSIIAITLIMTFFITSADSATFVLGMMTTHGNLNPPNKVKLIWGLIQSSIAAILLYFGGLDALQMASIITALPFAVIMLFMMYSLYISLAQEVKIKKGK